MSELTFQEEACQFTTPVSDSFILEKMPAANGTYVKVYLYVFFIYYHRLPGYDLGKIASELNLLESEVLEALRHWNAQGALRLMKKSGEDAYCISFSVKTEKTPDPSGSSDSSSLSPSKNTSKVIRVEQPPVYSPEEMTLYMKNPEISRMYSEISHLLGTQLSQASCSRIFGFYDYYRLPVDVIIYLVRYCVEKDKRDLRYIEKVAMDWSDSGVHSVEEAEAYVHRFDCYLPVFRALHSSAVIPTDDQKKMIDRWIQEYGMDMDVLVEAGKRTFERTGRAQFPYMKSIIEGWHKLEIRTMEGVQAADAAHSNRPEAAASAAQRTAGYRDNKYIPSNNYNYDEILAQHRKRLYEQYEQNDQKESL